jgi:hypothetical protein
MSSALGARCWVLSAVCLGLLKLVPATENAEAPDVGADGRRPRRPPLCQQAPTSEALPARKGAGSDCARRPLRYPFDSGPPVEAPVQAQDRLNPIAFHDRDVEAVASRKRFLQQSDFVGAIDIGAQDRIDGVNDVVEKLESAGDRLAAVDGHVAMDDLLIDFHARYVDLFRMLSKMLL